MRAIVLCLASLATVATASCGSCEPDRSSGASQKRPPFVVSATAPSQPVASVPPHVAPAPKLACRVITLDGDARIEDGVSGPDAGTAPLLLQGLVPTETWFDVGKAGRVVAKDPRTSRETTFKGPARVRACVGAAEESWVAGGHFESSVGSGESPGAEEWVMTPFGVVRYTAAKLSVDVGARDADVTAESGQAFLWGGAADAGPDDEGWARVTTGKFKLALRDTGAAALDRCSKLATSAHALAALVMAPGGGADGGTIREQVTTRRLARAACGVATVRTNALGHAEAAPMLKALADANAAWSGLPQ
jgi:hypothetical protein